MRFSGRPDRLVRCLAAVATAAGLAWAAPTARASSHSDAPLIKQDPQANLTDVYAFVRMTPSGRKLLVVEVNVHPFCEPGDGVTYDRFADDALYSIHIADPNTGATLMRYDFRFSPVSTNGSYKNLDTILSYGRGTEVGPIQDVGDARQNYVQTYTVTKTAGGSSTVIGSSLMCPPPNVGLRTTPAYNDPNTGLAVSGAASRAALDRYTRETVFDLASGETVFAGMREDSFFADAPGIFDLLDPRILSTDGNGVDGFKGFNVLHYAIAIPISQLPAVQYTAPFPSRTSTGVGVYASVSRPRITLRKTDSVSADSGPWIQVNRLANPLFNEVLVGLRDKDNYNRDAPTVDAARYAKYALNPEVAVLINAVYGTHFATTGRTDLAAVYIPDVVRVDTTTGGVPVAGEAGFSRLSFIGGETTTNGAGVAIPAGWPNGRRFGDDVVDIALTAVASGPGYSSVTVIGDNVDHNDQVYNMTFPYAATPNSGTRNFKDPTPGTTGVD